MAGWTDSEYGDAQDGRPRDGRQVRTDGGTSDDDVAEIKRLLEEEGDDGDLADAVADEDDDEDESSPAMDFGMKLGVPLALAAVALLFVGPEPLLTLTPGDVVFVGTTEGDGAGNITYISAATFALSLLAGLFYPTFAGDVGEDFKMDLGLGIALPTVGFVALLVLAMLFWPVLYSLLHGAFVEAGIFLVIAVVAVGIAVAGSIITLALVALATLYSVGPALVGSYLGGFVGELIAT